MYRVRSLLHTVHICAVFTCASTQFLTYGMQSTCIQVHNLDVWIHSAPTSGACTGCTPYMYCTSSVQPRGNLTDIDSLFSLSLSPQVCPYMAYMAYMGKSGRSMILPRIVHPSIKHPTIQAHFRLVERPSSSKAQTHTRWGPREDPNGGEGSGRLFGSALTENGSW